MHGKTSQIHHDATGVFASLPDPFVATRYHSLVVEPTSVPDVLEVTASTSDGVVMGLRHRTLAVEGVQFHPESILTTHGEQIIRNFAQAAGRRLLLDSRRYHGRRPIRGGPVPRKRYL
jgi:anthranilate synthase/aminodeoxychorismate synthase-like glutamine amidotransferase